MLDGIEDVMRVDQTGGVDVTRRADRVIVVDEEIGLGTRSRVG